MKCVRLFCIISAFWIDLINCKLCDVNDHDCTTSSANNNFGGFVNGIDDTVRASEPLHRDVVVAELPTLIYKLNNATLSGMSNCSVTKLKVFREDSSFEYNLECPHITVEGDIEVKGNMAMFYVDGNGFFKVTCDDYVFEFKGNFERHIQENNEKHVQITAFTVNPYPRGHVAFTFILDGQEEKSTELNKFMNDNWKTTDEMLRKPTVNNFMGLFIENVNAYLKSVPINRVLSKHH